MKRTFFLLIVLIIVNCLYSEEFIGTSLIEPSATGIAMGSYGMGADIWHKNPIDALSNPAKLGYFKDCSYGFSLSHPLKEVYKDSYYLNSYVAYGGKGIGMLLPVTGTINNMNKTPASYEKKVAFALGINLLEFSNTFLKANIEDLYPKFDISIGYSYSYYILNKQNEKKTSYLDDLGFIIKYSPLVGDNNGQISCDITTSFNLSNPSKTTMEYPSGTGQTEPTPSKFPYGQQFAFALKMHSKLDSNSKFIKFSDNAFSVATNFGFSQYGKEKYEKGYGMELTLLDMLSFRMGNQEEFIPYYYYYPDGYYGFGLNLGLKKYFKFQINYVKLSDIHNLPELWDFALNLNLVNIIKKIKS